MNKILKLQDLYDAGTMLFFGFVGLDVDTKKLKYFICLDEKRNFDLRFAKEFDPLNIGNLPICYGDYELKRFDTLFPRELQSFADETLKIQQKFNEENGYPTSFFQDNEASLRYASSLYHLKVNIAKYVPFENLIVIPASAVSWPSLNPSEKKYVKDGIVHEQGHMKATRFSFDEKNALLNIIMGYWEYAIKYIPIIIGSNNLLLEPVNALSSETHLTPREKASKAIEEISNDYECYKSFPIYYQGYYPNLGKELDALCDGRFISGRYNGGLNLLENSLRQIEACEYMINDLFKCLTEATLNSNFEAEGHARRLIKQYAELKRK